jgi:leucyl-tRNA synthetase
MLKTTNKLGLISRFTSNYCRSSLPASKVISLTKSKACTISINKTSNFHSYSKWLAEDKEKFYALSMFPYPSGNLHMGHVRVYTISDTLARYQRMSNPTSTKVIHPMGWDAFGLPAENAAIERGINPKDWTLSNIDVMKNQLSLMDTKFDWDKEVITCNKDYYKFTQKLILLLHEHGLLYQKEALVNWDPVDKTVLANEQVDSEGRSWRSGAIVEQKYLKQWFVKITDYAEDLLKDLELLTGWPEKVRTMQSNWIGKSEGCEINFKLNLPNTDLNKLTVFTTRADTLYGVQYLAVSLNHPIIKSALVTDNVRSEVDRVKLESKNSEELSMQGVKLGIDVINPLTKEPIPVYAAPYVLEDYGTGSVMGVPAHDQRDWNFFHLNEISKDLKFVIGPSADPDHLDQTQPFLEDGIMLSLGKNGIFGAKTSIQARKSITELIAQQGAGKAVNQYRLRDWLISRQRYWGAPIPFIHCDSCGVVPVPDEQLPVELPDLDVLSNEGGSPLAKSSEFVNCQCPK